MDKPRHPNVVRTWKFERIRKPAAPKKQQQVRPVKNVRGPCMARTAAVSIGVVEDRNAQPA